jgi:cellulose biosynthesis protein BcsQ
MLIFGKRIDSELKRIISCGNNKEYQELFHDIIRIHRSIFTEENLPAAEDAILEFVNIALDKMWENEGCVRSMGVYKSFIPIREAIKNADNERKTAIEYAEYERLKQKFENLT